MLKKIKKKHFVIFFIPLFLALVIFGIVTSVNSYRKSNFNATVIEKYQDSTPFHSITIKHNYVILDTWFGEKRFCVDDELYSAIEVGEEYSFKKDAHMNWVTLTPDK